MSDEYRRWLKQAEADFVAAKNSLEDGNLAHLAVRAFCSLPLDGGG